jgi:hypothetical protein
MTIIDVLADYEPFHSRFQLLHLVIVRNGLTIYGSYKQALREIASRLPSIAEESQKLLRMRLDDGKHNLDRIIEQLEYVTFKDRVRELAYLVGLATAMKKLIGELTPEKRLLYEEQYWLDYVCSSVARELIADGRISSQTVDLIHAMPIRQRQEILAKLKDPVGQQSLVHWYSTFHLELPEPDQVCVLTTFELVNKCLEGRGFML